MQDFSNNSKAIILLTSNLNIANTSLKQKVLTSIEYDKLATALYSIGKEPSELLENNGDDVLSKLTNFDISRLKTLLNRGFLLSQAIEYWHKRGICLITRADKEYPKILKIRLKDKTPPVLYVCGELSLLKKGGLAIVGSRSIDDEILNYTKEVAQSAANNSIQIISGGAKGVDKTAMLSALNEGGTVCGILSDNLEKSVLSREYREFIINKQLLLISPYNPNVNFNVGNAMGRNKLIYALSNSSLIVNSDYKKGGTWNGAIEQLEKYNFIKVYVRKSDKMPQGNAELLKKGAEIWNFPQTSDEWKSILNRKIPIQRDLFDKR